MTIAERNAKLKHFITCLKCGVSGKVCDDNCPVQYEAGNMGEIIENLEAISKTLEQEPFINKPCVAHKVCHEDKVKTLDKIRAEIMDTGAYEQEVTGKTEFLKGINYCLSVIDKYNTEKKE